MKVALVYDRVNKWGGAERVLLTLHEMFPEAPLYTSIFAPGTASWTRVFPKVIPSFLNKISFLRQKHEFLGYLMPFVFESFNFDGYDIVISVTSEAAKGIITKPWTLHISYCLTPTRYLWSHYADYFPKRLFRYVSLPVVSTLRVWDYIQAQRPDVLVTLSRATALRIAKYYGRQSQIIPPPVDTDKFKPAAENIKGTYFLIVSRLVSYKHVEIAIEACNRLNLPLKVVGTGLQLKRLKKIAKSQIEFMGNLTDRDLIHYYQNCRALLFPQEEDFGITALEAMSCGKPVIAFGQGAASEIIRQGLTGEIFWPQTVEALMEILMKFNDQNYKIDDCRQEALKYSKVFFKNKFKKLVMVAWNKIKKEKLM